MHRLDILCRVSVRSLTVSREDIAEYTGARRAVVCVSGTNALHMALMLASVERDDEVLTPISVVYSHVQCHILHRGASCLHRCGL